MDSFIKCIQSLRLGTTPYGKAPHKPILLLAVIDGFERGYLRDAEVSITPDLVTGFHDYWKLLVKTPHVPNFSLPFFHLGSEPSGIWQLESMPGKTIPVTKSNSIKSFKALTETVQFATLSDEFYQALLDPFQRRELKQTVLEYYFPATAHLLEGKYSSYSDDIKSEILYEPGENYAQKVIKRFEQMKADEMEEEIIVRSNIFKKAILELYGGQCAITGLKVDSPNSITLVDACHIVPFAESHDDTITNGIALSPTFHRAFDRGIISISDNYKVILHPNIKDLSPAKELEKYLGHEIYLPIEKRFYPNLEKLNKHRRRFSF